MSVINAKSRIQAQTQGNLY